MPDTGVAGRSKWRVPELPHDGPLLPSPTGRIPATLPWKDPLVDHRRDRVPVLGHPFGFAVTGVLACACLDAGCDSLRQRTQSFEIVVRGVPSGMPVLYAIVICAPVKRKGPSTVWRLSVDAYLETHRGSSRLSDAEGRAVSRERIDTLRGGVLVWLGIDRLKLEDRVTGEEYYFRLETGRTQETVGVRMLPGTKQHSRHFMLNVRSIRSPRPCERSRRAAEGP